ncbi:MAG: GTPase, partial [Solirubrobacterales bacterium]
MNSVPTVAVVGFPNVGKSTLVNRLAGGREAVVHSEAGVTRDRKRVRCDWNGREFDLLDTGGIDLDDESEMATDIQRQARLGMEEADAIVLVTDGKSGMRSGDTDMARRLRSSPVPVILVVNKSDRAEDQYGAAEFHALGLGEPYP